MYRESVGNTQALQSHYKGKKHGKYIGILLNWEEIGLAGNGERPGRQFTQDVGRDWFKAHAHFTRLP